VTGPNERYGRFAWGIRRDLAEKGWVPARYWVLWWGLLGAAIVVFYVVLTPIWLGLRAAAWVAELRARLRGDQAGSSR
jgi:hypothetical protein